METENLHFLVVKDSQFQGILQSGLATPQQEVKIDVRSVDAATKSLPAEINGSAWTFARHQDIQEREEQERGQAQDRLIRVAKLAHDFNNILTVISLYSQMLRQNPSMSRPDEFLEKIDVQTKRAAILVMQILDLSAHASVQSTPNVAQPTIEERAGLELDLLPGGNETLLLVEDEGEVRDALLALFRGLGYSVLVAGDGAAAVAIFEEVGGRIDLVLSDMVMPGMSGAELYYTLRDRKPDLKMILSTGYPLNNQDNTLLGQGVIAWIQKPYPIGAIAEKVRSALDIGLALKPSA
jgi:CheY-like chemotaxis protein